MNNPAYQFIDELIRNHAEETENGYELPYSEVEDTIKRLINERIDLVFAADQYSRGLKPIIDNQTGEVFWRPQ